MSATPEEAGRRGLEIRIRRLDAALRGSVSALIYNGVSEQEIQKAVTEAITEGQELARDLG